MHNQPYNVEVRDLLTQLQNIVAFPDTNQNPNEQRRRSARLFARLLAVCNLTPPQLARAMGMAPQTINRWQSGKTLPRLGQIKKLQEVFGQKGQETGRAVISPHAPTSPQFIGFRSLEEVLMLEAEAQEVWVVKDGVLREGVRGLIGDMVLRGLKQGTHFHYIFGSDTAAETSFREQLAAWVKNESFIGQLTGYRLLDARLAYEIGLSAAPGAWVAIWYSDAQAEQLQRRFDVFKALPLRQYADATRTQIQNEDGQPCWLELPSPSAWKLMELFKRRCEAWNAEMGNSSTGVEVLRVEGVDKLPRH